MYLLLNHLGKGVKKSILRLNKWCTQAVWPYYRPSSYCILNKMLVTTFPWLILLTKSGYYWPILWALAPIQLTLPSTESAEMDKVELWHVWHQHWPKIGSGPSLCPVALLAVLGCRKNLLISSNLTYPTVLVFLTLMDSISHNCIVVRECNLCCGITMLDQWSH